jgi:PadR family transcriptional regulator, regulatory protein PadR
MDNTEQPTPGSEREGLSASQAGAQAQLRKGVLELCVLSILSEGDAYPTEIIDKLRDTRLVVVEGTLYPLLTRLKNTGFLAYRWEESTSGPPRKYYKLTPSGESLLRELAQSWRELVESVNRTLENGKKFTQS